MSYHNHIMNLSPKLSEEDKDSTSNREFVLYKLGHMAARHAAAEIAFEADKEIERIKIERQYLRRALVGLLASHDDFMECAKNPALGTPNIEWSEEFAYHARLILMENGPQEEDRYIKSYYSKGLNDD